jgi:hypothetical protein
MKNSIFLVILILLVSCNPNIDLSKIIPSDVDQFARAFIDQLGKGNIDQCLANVVENMQTDEGRTFLSNVASGINGIQFDSLEMINARFTKRLGDNPLTNYVLEYEQEIRSQSVYFFIQIFEENGITKISGFDARQMEVPLKIAHAFTFIGKPAINYIFFILTVTSISFVIFTLVSAILTPMKRKWLWMVGILFALVKFKLNWTTSEFDFQLLSFQILGAGFSKSGLVAPWIISFSIPVFAITFWIKKLKHDKEQSEDQKISINITESN